MRDWVGPLSAKLSILRCAPTRRCQTHVVNGAQAHVSELAANRVSENPRLGASLADPQIQAAAVGVHAGLPELLHFHGGKPVEGPSHIRLPSTPYRIPYFGWRLWQTMADVERYQPQR